MNPSVLITGWRGFVGKNVWEECMKMHLNIGVVGRNDPFPTDRYDYVINCAGEISDENRMMESNVLFVKELLEWSREAGVKKIIHIGSSSEYDDSFNFPRPESLICSAKNLYEATKIAATALCQAYADEYDMDIIVARPFSLYGPFDTPRKLMSRLVDSYKRKSFVDLYEGNHDWIFIDDFVRGILSLLNFPKSNTKGDIVNFCCGISNSNDEVVFYLEKALGNKLLINRKNCKLHSYGGARWVGDNTKAQIKYKWTPKFSLETGLKELVMRELKNELVDQL